VGVMTAQRPGSPMTAARLLGIIKWVLPLALAGIAVFFEWSEHIAREQEDISSGFIGEIILFAVVGPVAVFATLVWVSRLLRAYAEASTALATANRDLEAKVAERTAHLEAATAELADTNADLARANTELRQLDRLKSEFVSLVSHQLRAPLTNIRGALEIVGGDAAPLPPSSRRTLEILTLESERLSSLIMTILDVSRLEAGRLSPRLGLVAVEPLLARACASTLGADPGRPWSLEVQPGLPPAWADETLLEEVVRNLLENAAQYSPLGQPVEVDASVGEAGIRVAVTDHGQGIPPEEQGLIFDSFHRIGEDDSAVQGYGLGLYFADRLVRAMGGSVAVESPVRPDDGAPGSRFIVTLPVAVDGPSGTDDHLDDDPDDGPDDGVGDA
jgi:signal transduction histidine kinase